MFNCYEVVVKGFDGSTDETDDHILWVMSDSEDHLRDYLSANLHNIETIYQLPLEASTKEGLDFSLVGEDDFRESAKLNLKIEELVSRKKPCPQQLLQHLSKLYVTSREYGWKALSWIVKVLRLV